MLHSVSTSLLLLEELVKRLWSIPQTIVTSLKNCVMKNIMRHDRNKKNHARRKFYLFYRHLAHSAAIFCILPLIRGKYSRLSILSSDTDDLVSYNSREKAVEFLLEPRNTS